MQYRGVCWLGLEEETCKRHGRLLDLCRAAGKEEAREPRHHREEVRRGQDAQRAARDLTQASAGPCMRYAMEQHSNRAWEQTLAMKLQGRGRCGGRASMPGTSFQRPGRLTGTLAYMANVPATASFTLMLFPNVASRKKGMQCTHLIAGNGALLGY